MQLLDVFGFGATFPFGALLALDASGIANIKKSWFPDASEVCQRASSLLLDETE